MTSPPVHANGDAGMTITAAAQVLGVSEKTIRRRIGRGELVAERVERPHGFEYRVQLPVYPSDQGDSPGDQTVSTPPASNGRHPSTHADQAGILALVAEVRRLNDERAELYGRLGYMQAELAQA